jgi:periplasmic protein CpxP/Spy
MENKKCNRKHRGRWIVYTIVVAAITLAAAGAFGRHFMGHMMNPERIQKVIDWKVTDVLDEIKATEAQSEKVRALTDQLVKKGFALHAEGRESHKVMLAGWQEEEVDREALYEQVDEKIERFRGFAHEMIDASVELHEILTPQQRVQLVHRIESHMDHHRRGFGCSHGSE